MPGTVEGPNPSRTTPSVAHGVTSAEFPKPSLPAPDVPPSAPSKRRASDAEDDVLEWLSKRWWLLTTVAALSVSALLLYQAKADLETVNGLRSALDEHSEALTKATGSLEALNANVHELSDRTLRLESTITSLSQSIGRLEGRIAVLPAPGSTDPHNPKTQP